MKEIQGNLWEFYDRGHLVCIPTNGFVKANGTATMGRGVAQQAAQRFPGLPLKLGSLIREHGWQGVHRLLDRLWAFPVKPDKGICNEHRTNVVFNLRRYYKPGEEVPGFALIASPHIIQHSLECLEAIRLKLPETARFCLPRPGCGAGGLEWKNVKPLCEPYGDWLWIVDLHYAPPRS